MISADLTHNYGDTTLIGKLPKLDFYIERAAGCEVPVLITGETGTGKELIAKAIHNLSDRKDKPFIPVNCCGFPESLIESELFGYKKGAFTGANSDKSGKFEDADGGTLLLDEIGELDIRFQPKLLRVLNDGSYSRLGDRKIIYSDARIITSTNQPTDMLARSPQFRKDLYYRINRYTIHLLPLRERKDDIPALTEHFILKHLAQKYQIDVQDIEEHKNFPGLIDDLTHELKQYNWPGNVRQLENTIERLVIDSGGDMVSLDTDNLHLDKPDQPLDNSPYEDGQLSVPLNFPTTLKKISEEAKKRAIMEALRMCKGKVIEAAESLGIERSNLYKLVKQHDINPEEYK